MQFPLPKGPLPPAPDVIHGWRVTSYFGGRKHPITGVASTHSGMDLAYYGCTGQPILAPVSGRVSQTWDIGGGGYWTGLKGDDGSYWGFGHAERFAPGVNGQWVEAGAVLAYVGTSGGSTGPHLHIAYKAPGAYRYSDPLDLLLAAAAGPTANDWLHDMTEAELDAKLEAHTARVEAHTKTLATQIIGIAEENQAEILSALLRTMVSLAKLDRADAEVIAKSLGVTLPAQTVN